MPKPLHGAWIEMIRMAVGKPDVLGVEDVLPDVLRNDVGERPTAEIGVVLAAEPGIGRKNWNILVSNEGGVSNCLNSEHWMVLEGRRNCGGSQAWGPEALIAYFGL